MVQFQLQQSHSPSLHNPKSAIFTNPSASKRRLSNFRSLWSKQRKENGWWSLRIAIQHLFFCKRQKPDVNKEHKNLNPVKSTFGLNNVLVGRLPLIYWYFPLNERLTKQSSWVGLIHLEKSIPQQHDKLLDYPSKKESSDLQVPPRMYWHVTEDESPATCQMNSF